jgi:acyl carrier protein
MKDQQIPMQMMEHVIRIIRTLAGEAELPEHLASVAITPEDTVETLGIDSLGAVSLIERLETELDITLPDDFLDIADDIAGIAHRLDAIAHGGVDMAGDISGASQEATELLRTPTQ